MANATLEAQAQDTATVQCGLRPKCTDCTYQGSKIPVDQAVQGRGPYTVCRAYQELCSRFQEP